MYIKIIGEEEKYNVTLQPFTTQHGYRAVKFVGDEIPETNKGFKAYNNDDEEIGDLSDFVYLYKPNQYSVGEDIIESPSGNDKPIPPNPLDVRLSRMSAQINSITPYTASELVGIQDTECIFHNVVKDGSLTANLKTNSGLFLPCAVARVDTDVRVTFEELTEVGTVTISIQ